MTSRLATNISSLSTGYNKFGGGTLEMHASNSYVGSYSFNEGFVKLTLGSVSGEAGVIPNVSTVTVNGATWDLNGRRESWATTGTFVLKSGSVINSDANQTTFDPMSGPQSYLSAGTYNLESGIMGTRLAGAGTINKDTAGTVAFSGRGSFSGTANLNGGRFEMTGFLPASITHVNTGATLAGAGAGVDNRHYTNTGVIGKTAVHSGGTIAPGLASDTTGLLLVRADVDNGFALESGGTLDIDLGGTTAGTGYDRLIVTGGLAGATSPVSLAGDLSVDLVNGFDAQEGDLFFILTQEVTFSGTGSVGAVNGTFAGLAEGAEFFADGERFKISYFGNAGANSLTGGNDVVLQTLAVPEPSSLAAVGAAATARTSKRSRSSSFATTQATPIPHRSRNVACVFARFYFDSDGMSTSSSRIA